MLLDILTQLLPPFIIRNTFKVSVPLITLSALLSLKLISNKYLFVQEIFSHTHTVYKDVRNAFQNNTEVMESLL